MPLPESFVWTRFGTEAGQTIEHIIERKERERRDNGGVFLWGIGNNISPSIPQLLASQHRPMVAFSPIKSKPRSIDVEPGQVAVWCRATSPNGDQFDLPSASLVTSRYSRGKSKHFALVCHSEQPLTITSSREALALECLVNAKSGARIGFSQVTAVVKKNANSCPQEHLYTVAMSCELVHPYVVTLCDPVVVQDIEDEQSLNQMLVGERSRIERSGSQSQLSLQLY